MIWLTAVAVAMALALSGLLLSWRIELRERRHSALIATSIENLIKLIQGVQKHRGLGAQGTPDAAQQLDALRAQMERQWRDQYERLSVTSPALAKLVDQLQRQWLLVRNNPGDFDMHCRLLDRMLTTVEIFERQCAQLRNDWKLTVASRCRAIEDLARLRGRSAQAARFSKCPIELVVSLRYLGQCVKAGSLYRDDLKIGAALDEIEKNLLATDRVSITPGRCFELLTPSVDRALDALLLVLVEAPARGKLRQSQYGLPRASATAV